MTLDQFTTLYNAYRQSKWPEGHTAPYVTFPLIKSKITKKREDTYEKDYRGIPMLVASRPAVSKKVPDTNSITKLYQAMFEYYTGGKLKRISSEGNYRPGIGFVKSANKGFADLHGIYKGRAIYIEVKQEKEKQLPTQVKFQQWVNDSGGIYLVIRSFDEMYNFIQKLLKSEI